MKQCDTTILFSFSLQHNLQQSTASRAKGKTETPWKSGTRHHRLSILIIVDITLHDMARHGMTAKRDNIRTTQASTV